jgi:hypothetical protein
MNAKSSITSDLKVLVKVVEMYGNAELSENITQYSNNQNAIKARDLKSNNPIQERLKKEVETLDDGGYIYEVKRGETSKGKMIISNEDAGLALLATDLGEPWSCHQKYKVMDDSHSKIFGRNDVNGAKIVALYRAVHSISPALNDFDDTVFGHYTLTKYFLAYAVAEIIKNEPSGRWLFSNFRQVVENGKLEDFIVMFRRLASTTVDDLNAEVAELTADGDFDYKRDLKGQKWCRTMCERLKAAYNKDVKRRKAQPVSELVEPLRG